MLMEVRGNPLVVITRKPKQQSPGVQRVEEAKDWSNGVESRSLSKGWTTRRRALLVYKKP